MKNKKERMERIKLFVLTLTIFTVVGFGVKWVLSESGLIAPSQQRQQPPLSKASFSSPHISARDVTKAQSVVTQFIPIYFNQDMDTLRMMSTEKMFALLQEEIENPLKKQRAILKKIEKVGCSPDAGRIHCFATIRVAEPKEGDRSQLEEQVYEVTLRLKEMEWLVDEVNVRGSFE